MRTLQDGRVTPQRSAQGCEVLACIVCLCETQQKRIRSRLTELSRANQCRCHHPPPRKVLPRYFFSLLCLYFFSYSLWWLGRLHCGTTDRSVSEKTMLREQPGAKKQKTDAKGLRPTITSLIRHKLQLRGCPSPASQASCRVAVEVSRASWEWGWSGKQEQG